MTNLGLGNIIMRLYLLCFLWNIKMKTNHLVIAEINERSFSVAKNLKLGLLAIVLEAGFVGSLSAVNGKEPLKIEALR